MTSPSPTVRRRELGARLRSLRLAAGMTVEDVAARMEVSAAKISRIETAARGVSVADLRFLCDLYGVLPNDRERLLALNRDSKRRSWWQQHGLPDWVATYIGLEDAALSIHQYDTSLVPGLLQTEAYAQALISGMTPDADDETVTQLVAARMARQNLLRSDQPPELWTVVDEVALRRLVGGPEVMRAQLSALADRSQPKNITVQVIPLEAGAHPGMNAAFTILHLQEVSDVVYVEGLSGNFYLESPGDLSRYRKNFDRLRAIALSPRDSRDRLLMLATTLPL